MTTVVSYLLCHVHPFSQHFAILRSSWGASFSESICVQKAREGIH